MSGTRLALASFLLVGLGASASAQEGVPGGWDEQVTVQPFQAAKPSRPAYGYGTSPWSYGGMNDDPVVTGPTRTPPTATPTPLNSFGPPPQTFNGLGLFGDVVHKTTTRKRPRR